MQTIVNSYDANKYQLHKRSHCLRSDRPGFSMIFPSCNKGSGKSDRHTDSRSLSRERDMAHKQNAAVGYTITISSVTEFRNSAGCPLRKWCVTVALFFTEWLHILSKSSGHWHPQNIEGSLSTRNTSCSHSWHGFCMSQNARSTPKKNCMELSHSRIEASWLQTLETRKPEHLLP